MAEAPVVGSTRKTLRVLLIEDSEFDAVLLVNLLRQGGYAIAYRRVQSAAAMDEALAAQEWDLIISDHEMPGFSAPEALANLQRSGRDLPFLIVSGGIGEATAVAAMKAGASDYLIKGQLGRLVPAVERELREAANRRAKRQAEASLRESEQRYRLLWENSPDAVVLMDADGRIAFANPAVGTTFGFAPQGLVGTHFEALLADRGVGGDIPGLSSHWEPGKGMVMRQMVETVGLHQQGHAIPIEVGLSSMEMEGRTWFIAFIRDITQRRQAELALRDTEEQLFVAREIQQRLFPRSFPDCPGYDIAGASYPAEATGGDYFDFFPMRDGGQGIVIGDVSGHGVGPALLMAETRAYLRIVALNRAEPCAVLAQANRALAEDVGGERFVTVLLARLDAARRHLTYASAGHPGGFLLGPDGALKLILKRTGLPLGIRPEGVFEPGNPIDLETGDLLVMLTDGFEEATAPDGMPFGVNRALALVREHCNRTSEEIVEALYRGVRAYAQGEAQLDDLTAVVVKVLG